MRFLRIALDDPKVRDAFGPTLAVCALHLLEIAPRLDWEELRFLVGETIDRLEEAENKGAADDTDSLAAAIRGSDADGAYRARHPDPETNDHDALPAGAANAWSPTVARLRRQLSEPGCLVCRAQQRALAGYFDWLSKDILEAPIYRWNAAFWLCREHAHGCALRGHEAVVSSLEKAIQERWLADLGRLADDLSGKPHDRLLCRLAEVPRRLRESRSDGAQGLRTLRSELWTTLKEAPRPPRRILPGLRERSLRPSACPACVYLDTTAAKNTDLLVRGVADPGTLRVYHESGGLWFRHLPQVLDYCGDSERLSVLVRALRVRLELLQWELREYQRKQSWTLRYEPKGTEQDAWRRAVAQYTGP